MFFFIREANDIIAAFIALSFIIVTPSNERERKKKFVSSHLDGKNQLNSPHSFLDWMKQHINMRIWGRKEKEWCYRKLMNFHHVNILYGKKQYCMLYGIHIIMAFSWCAKSKIYTWKHQIFFGWIKWSTCNEWNLSAIWSENCIKMCFDKKILEFRDVDDVH